LNQPIPFTGRPNDAAECDLSEIRVYPAADERIIKARERVDVFNSGRSECFAANARGPKNIKQLTTDAADPMRQQTTVQEN